MLIRILFIAMLLFTAIGAQAQTTCQRVATDAPNIALMRCEHSIAMNEVEQLTTLGTNLAAQLALTKADLATAQQQLSDILRYAKNCGDKPGCFVPISPIVGPSPSLISPSTTAPTVLPPVKK